MVIFCNVKATKRRENKRRETQRKGKHILLANNLRCACICDVEDKRDMKKYIDHDKKFLKKFADHARVLRTI